MAANAGNRNLRSQCFRSPSAPDFLPDVYLHIKHFDMNKRIGEYLMANATLTFYKFLLQVAVLE